MSDSFGAAGSVVLLGGGHAHVEVVRRLGLLGLGGKLTLVSPSRNAPYSGMLPGYISGEYRFEDFHIDLAHLCARSGVTFLEDAAAGIDPDSRTVLLSTGQFLNYELLSIDVGSVPSLPTGISKGISVKPIASFTERLSRLDALVAQGRPLRLAVIGQGVAGVEVAFALKRRYEGKGVQFSLAGRASEPVRERSHRARQLVKREMQKAGIAHHPSFDVVALIDGELISRDGRRLAVDELIWTTSSGAPGWLAATGLLLDESGFIRVDETLRSLSHPEIFAAGDIASLADPRPKAGVFAVRQGPVLADNIRRSLAHETLQPYRPQRSWLVLISMADGRAIADKWGLAICGRWVARWKHRTDSRFLMQYR